MQLSLYGYKSEVMDRINRIHKELSAIVTEVISEVTHKEISMGQQTRYKDHFFIKSESHPGRLYIEIKEGCFDLVLSGQMVTGKLSPEMFAICKSTHHGHKHPNDVAPFWRVNLDDWDKIRAAIRAYGKLR